MSSVTGRYLTIQNGFLIRFPHVEAIRKAGYGHSNCQKVAYYVSDLCWMTVQGFYRDEVLFEEGLQKYEQTLISITMI